MIESPHSLEPALGSRPGPSRRPRLPWWALGALLILGRLDRLEAQGASVPVAEERLRLPADLPACVDGAMADVDGDGLLDLVRASEHVVHVLLQRPGGRYEGHPLRPSIPYPGRVVRSVALGRLRPGGTAPDLVVVLQGGQAEMFWNDGAGNFAPAPFPLPAPVAPIARAIVFDLDRSPPSEILMVPEQGRAQILLGQLDGSHRDAPGLLNPNLILQSPRVVLIDADGDGDEDMVVASPFQAAPFLLENGLGGFQAQRALPVRGGHSALAVADLDRDGREDLVLARAAPLPAEVEIVLFPSSGPTLYALATPFLLDSAAQAVAMADLNGDAVHDVLVLQADGRLRVGVNDRLPRFGLTMSLGPLAFAPRACLLAGDTDTDGDAEVFLGGARAGGTVVRDSFLLGRAQGTSFLDTEAVGMPIGALAVTATAGAAVDGDGDGELDLVTFGDGRSVVYANPSGSARFVDRAGTIAPITLRGITRVQRVSLDTPDRDLLVVADAASGSATPPGLRLLTVRGQNYGDVSSRLPAAAQHGFLDVAAVKAMLVGGFPRGVDDLVLADSVRGLVLLANAATAFSEVAGAFAPALPSEATQRLLVGDVNGDRRADVLALGFGVRGLVMDVYLRGPTNQVPLFTAAAFAAPIAGQSVTSAVLSDLDGDGDLDVLVAIGAAVARPLMLLVNDGTGRFFDRTSVRLTAPIPIVIDHVAVVQARGAAPSILLGATQGEALSVLRGDGAGNFPTLGEQSVHGSTRVRGFVVDDFDSDGDDDCCVLVEGGHPTILLGTNLQLTQMGVASAGRTLHIRMRGPSPVAVAAWFWSPTGASRFVLPDWGVLRLAAPLTSLAVLPFGPARTVDIQFPSPPSAVDLTLFFQLAVYDPLAASLRLSNLEPCVLIGN